MSRNSTLPAAKGAKAIKKGAATIRFFEFKSKKPADTTKPKPADTTKPEAEAKPAEAKIAREPWPESPLLKKQVRVMVASTHPSSLGLVGMVMSHYQSAEDHGPDQGVLTVMMPGKDSKKQSEGIVHIPAAECCLVDQLPAHVENAPARLNYKVFQNQRRWEACQTI